MSTFLQVLLILVCAAIVIGVVISRIVAWKKGKPPCDCGYSECPGCSSCKRAKQKKKQD